MATLWAAQRHSYRQRPSPANLTGPSPIPGHCFLLTLPDDIIHDICDMVDRMFGGPLDLDNRNQAIFGEEFAIMALACSAPNLAKLHITTTSTWRDTEFLLNKQNKRITGPKVTLPSLTTLVVVTLSITPGPDLEKLNGLLHSAPNLTTLRIDSAWGGESLTARLPQLTRLELRRMDMGWEGLRKLVRRSPRLAEVLLTHDPLPGWSNYLAGPPVSPERALRALAPARLALRRLALHTWMPGDGDGRRRHPARLPLLEGVRLAERFPALVQLSLDARVVRGLPDLLAGMESLEGLVLMNVTASAAFGGEVDTLLEKARVLEWPRLRRVTMRSYRPDNAPWQVPAWEGLKQMLEGLGWRKLSEEESKPDLGVVVAGVSFLAVPDSQKIGLFADGQGGGEWGV
ncbi:uncharacterized protein B0H64DRAFT_474357 [Chaetomium fimeti]|uniref:F-box domain-containing protein n=1 Tax=Chaetomium fimeti TaxID=1854472 RepID=A0AAE0LS17_9PEZI|nr:hypothetical protein B0H64DRAFT_474357 [Chaetomium fimeti]